MSQGVLPLVFLVQISCNVYSIICQIILYVHDLHKEDLSTITFSMCQNLFAFFSSCVNSIIFTTVCCTVIVAYAVIPLIW